MWSTGVGALRGADEQPSVRATRRTARDDFPARLLRIIVGVLVGVTVTVVSWFRLGTVTRNTGWAEDVGRFLQEEIELGRLRVLWHPYEGYLHLVPRMLVDIAVTVQPISRSAGTR